MGFLKPTTKETEASEPIVTIIANEDKVAWFKKPNLRYLYFILFPACMGIELTSGFDSQMINALQIVPSWVTCKNPTTLVLCDCVANQELQISTTHKALSRESLQQHILLEPSCRYPSSRS